MMEEQSSPGIRPRADWRDPKSYEPLLKLDCSGWAGEFLGRNSAFVAALRPPQPDRSLDCASAKSRSISTPICFTDAVSIRALEQFGVIFCRSLRFFYFLGSGLQSFCVGRGGGAGDTRPPGRIRRLMFSASGYGDMLRGRRTHSFH